MTAAVYNQTGDSRIPAPVWTAVLGVSVAAHAAFLIYGLPKLDWQASELPKPIETEIVIQSEDLFFEATSPVESVLSDAAVPDAASVQPSETLSDAVSPTTPTQALTAADQSVRPEETQAADAASVRPETLAATSSDNGELVAPEQLEAASAQVATTAQADTVSAVDVEAVPEQAAAPLEAASQQSVAVTSPEAVVVIGQSNVTDVVQAIPEEPVFDALQSVQDVVTPETQTVETLASSTQTSDPAPVAVATAAPTSVQAANTSAPAVAHTVTPSASSVVVTSQPVSPSSSTAVTPNSNTVVAPVSSAPIASSPVVVSSNSSANQVSAVVVPSSSASPVQVQSGTVQAVSPVEEQVAAVQPSEVDLAALNPSDPNPSNVPAAPISSDPAANVPPEDVPTIDPLAEVTEYVSGYDIGQCAHLTVVSAGTDTAQIIAFGAIIPSFVEFYGRFEKDNGYEADLQVRPISRSQCSVLDEIDTSNGIESPGLVELERTVVRSGTRLIGVIQRDLPLGRIAQAEAAGLELNGKGPPELYLIDREGQIFDGRSYIRAETSTAAIGGWRFSIPVAFPSNEQDEYNLILAIWNRPKQNQPAAFTKLPASRIASVLEKPGVYSIEAFRMSR